MTCLKENKIIQQEAGIGPFLKKSGSLMLSQLLGNPEIKIFENKTFLIETLYANDTRRHAFSMFNACIVSPSCKLD